VTAEPEKQLDDAGVTGDSERSQDLKEQNSETGMQKAEIQKNEKIEECAISN
jgi:hypothetical protein